MVLVFGQQEAALLQGGPRDAAVHFETYRILQRYRAVSLHCHSTAFLYSPTSATVQMLIFYGRDVRHTDSRKSRHTTGKSHDDRKYCDYFTALRNVTTTGNNYIH